MKRLWSVLFCVSGAACGTSASQPDTAPGPDAPVPDQADARSAPYLVGTWQVSLTANSESDWSCELEVSEAAIVGRCDHQVPDVVGINCMRTARQWRLEGTYDLVSAAISVDQRERYEGTGCDSLGLPSRRDDLRVDYAEVRGALTAGTGGFVGSWRWTWAPVDGETYTCSLELEPGYEVAPVAWLMTCPDPLRVLAPDCARTDSQPNGIFGPNARRPDLQGNLSEAYHYVGAGCVAAGYPGSGSTGFPAGAELFMVADKE